MGQVTSLLQWQPAWQPSRVVRIDTGDVRGRRYQIETEQIDAFLGIPYARAPIRELRFKKPQPAVAWTEVRDATKFGARCPHIDISIEKFTVFYPKSEDCLSLNVFTPHTSEPTTSQQQPLLPVACWIHGGAFCMHSAAHYGDYGICKILCRKGIVVVTIQYRLGFFGFLSTADENCPGNLGLHDQTAALKWVQRNIAKFGGDPNNVTLWGQSAGGASVDYLHLSPHTRGLFHKIVPMSGTALNSFAINDAEYIRDLSFRFACQHGFKPPANADQATRNRALLAFYTQLPAHVIELSMLGRNGVNDGGRLDLTPVYDGDFFPRPFDVLRAEAPCLPTMTGITEFESLLFTALKPPRNSLRDELRQQIGHEFTKRRIHDATRESQAFDLYMSAIDRTNRRDYVAASLALASEMLIVNGVFEFASIQAKKGAPVFLYSFDYVNARNFGLASFLMPFKGATHCSELPYLFGRSIIANFYPTAADLAMTEIFSKLFTNFVRFGNPNGPPTAPQEWEPLTTRDPLRYFRIELADGGMRENFCGGRPLKWRQILEPCVCNRRVCTLVPPSASLPPPPPLPPPPSSILVVADAVDRKTEDAKSGENKLLMSASSHPLVVALL